MLAVGGGIIWTIFLSSIISVLSTSLRETAQYRLKYCPKGPLNPKQLFNTPLSASASTLAYAYAFLLNLFVMGKG